MLDGVRILIGVLNWGLGHASRSAHLIRILKDSGAEVVIASDGAALKFLKAEFPEQEFLELPELKVHYASPFGVQWSLVSQVPKFLASMRAERTVMYDFLKDHQLDLIISDNRYGIYHPDIPSVFITHQLNIPVSFGKRILRKLVNELMKNFIEIWIPDEEGSLLSGKLSMHKKSSKYLYIGALSHFYRQPNDDIIVSKASFLAILSGPEPLRTQLEENLVEQANRQAVPLKLVRGRVGGRIEHPDNELVELVDQLSSEELFTDVQQHLGLICRAGYSSIMDLCYLKVPALLLPTKGQKEQEYLAEHHHEQKQFFRVKENDLDLKAKLEDMLEAAFQPPELELKGEAQMELIRGRVLALLERSKIKEER